MNNNELIVIDENKNNLLMDQLAKKKVSLEKQFKERLADLFSEFTDEMISVEDISEKDITAFLGEDFEHDIIKKESIFKKVELVKESLSNILKIDYYKERNEIDEYSKTLSTFLSIKELDNIKDKVNTILFSKYKLDVIMQSSEALTSVFRGLSDKNVDLKIEYEIQKSILCNKNGYTPESVDKYFNEIKKYNEAKLKDNSIEKKSLKDFKSLLEVTDNWDGETPIYKSELLEQYKSRVDEIEKSRPKNTEGAKLYEEFKKYSKEINTKLNSKGNNVVFKSSTPKTNKEGLSLREQRLLRKKNNIKPVIESEHKEDEYQKTIVQEDKEDKIDYTNLLNNNQTSKNNKEEKEVIEIDNIITELEDIENTVERKVEEKNLTDVTPVVDVDNVFKVVEKAPDISILRGSNPDRLKLYNNSHKYGRLLYLPYSNYEILVKRITDRGQLSYILDLFQSMKLATDGVVEYEIVRVIYKNIEFFFDDTPSEIDFYKNLSPRDLPIIINTMALVSQKEDKDGKVLVNVDRITCSDPNHGEKFSLVKPIQIDLKETFKDIYPIELYYNNYNIYKENDFKNIFEAFNKSIDGNLVLLNYEDETLKYEVVYGKPSYFIISEETNKKKSDTIYKVFLSDLDEMTSEEIIEKYGYDLKDYCKNKSLLSIQLKFNEIIENNPDIEKEYLLDDDNRSEEEIEILDTYRIISKVFEGLNVMSNSIKEVLDVVSCIRQLKVSLKATGEVFINNDMINMYDLFNNVINLPSELYSSILEKYKEYLVDTYSYDYKASFIKIKSNNIAGLIDLTNHLKNEDEFTKEIESKFADNEEVKNLWLKRYKETKENLLSGKCTCGSEKFYVNHFNLLFFSISHQLGVKIGQTF